VGNGLQSRWSTSICGWGIKSLGDARGGKSGQQFRKGRTSRRGGQGGEGGRKKAGTILKKKGSGAERGGGKQGTEGPKTGERGGEPVYRDRLNRNQGGGKRIAENLDKKRKLVRSSQPVLSSLGLKKVGEEMGGVQQLQERSGGHVEGALQTRLCASKKGKKKVRKRLKAGVRKGRGAKKRKGG